MGMTQRIVCFSGRVQGVGFRYTTYHLAAGFDVTGYVKNLPDGRVECVVEGDAAHVDAFLGALADRMAGFIHSRTQTDAPPTGQFPAFDVRY